MKLPNLSKSEKAKRAALKRTARPRIASTIVLYRGERHNPKILMGQRSKRSDFMPSVFVFPGGRVDRADSYAPYIGELPARTARILEAAYSPRKARACVLASIRETWEETGLMLGKKYAWTKNVNDPSWNAFRQAGLKADLSDIEVFGRAVTPPHRHKRYDTWFFLNRVDNHPEPVGDSSELLNVGWYDFAEIERLELQRATQMMITILKEHLAKRSLSPKIFYSRMHRRQYLQDSFPP